MAPQCPGGGGTQAFSLALEDPHTLATTNPVSSLFSYHTRPSDLWTSAQTVSSNWTLSQFSAAQIPIQTYVFQESALPGSHEQCWGGQGSPLSSGSHLCCHIAHRQTGLSAQRQREWPGWKWFPDVDFTLIRLGCWEQSLGHKEHMGLAHSSLSSSTSPAPGWEAVRPGLSRPGRFSQPFLASSPLFPCSQLPLP